MMSAREQQQAHFVRGGCTHAPNTRPVGAHSWSVDVWESGPLSWHPATRLQSQSLILSNPLITSLRDPRELLH